MRGPMHCFATPLYVRPSGVRFTRVCASPVTVGRGRYAAAIRQPMLMRFERVTERSLRVLVVGGGGREHALSDALAQSAYVDSVLVAPGNGGTNGERVRRLVNVDAEDVDGIVEVAKENAVDLVVVGPEVALVLGVVDRLREAGIRVFGPSGEAAALEGSKTFAKEFMERHGIRSATYRRFETDEVEEARKYVREHAMPVVVKADGLAAGKGVVVAWNVKEGLNAVDGALVHGKFGDAGACVVVEEFLRGEELSFFAVCDGENAVALASAQDHKAVGEGDTGPNTGGMGAYSPAPVCDSVLHETIMRDVVLRTVDGMRKEGRKFCGVLFVGLMVEPDGSYNVLEYNVRFGDPECQVLCARMQSDLCEMLYRAADGTLDGYDARWSKESAVVVVMASQGYPGAYKRGGVISGFEDAETVDSVRVYHAGTTTRDGQIVADSGRVLGVTAMGADIVQARERAYEGVRRIEWKDAMYRRDIGWRAVRRLEAETQQQQQEMAA